ncbi:hypothetical protein L2E82_02843 [Cichorium intybus]|uniref:Uncharacterized protein n=1 Tax=Cichorium intybus TaxID=13427 RepID=A0ACB9H434_CICIN|nr:hypothetical protein L2E82_02843 [Cichorium intybus]
MSCIRSNCIILRSVFCFRFHDDFCAVNFVQKFSVTVKNPEPHILHHISVLSVCFVTLYSGFVVVGGFCFYFAFFLNFTFYILL